MEKDIENREDIISIMRVFYERLLKDSRVNFFFTEVTRVDQNLEEHFELLATFWEQSLFMKGGYYHNMFQIHKDVHQKFPFTNDHFNIWLDYFNQCIDEKYKGKNAEHMKTQALSMATVMKLKFSQ